MSVETPSGDQCRICRGDDSDEEPLYHPCKCAGSIKYVHEDCLVEWLSHSRRENSCELCGASYIFENIYAADMPARLPLRAYAYKLYITYLKVADRAMLLLRAIIMTSLASIALKYTYEISTTFGRNFTTHVSLPEVSQDLLNRISDGRAPYITVFDMKIKNRVIKELYGATIDGFGLLLITVASVFVLYLAAIWALNEPTLIHDLEHIARGEPGHMDVAYDEEEDEDGNGDVQAIVPVAAVENRARDGANDGRLAAAPELDLDAAIGAALGVPVRVGDDDDESDDDDDVADLIEGAPFFDEGENVWTFIEGLFGGPLLPRVGWFLIITIAAVFLISGVYMIPFLLGRATIYSLTKITMKLLLLLSRRGFIVLSKDFLRIAIMPEKVDIFPKTVEFDAMTYYLGCFAFFAIDYLFYVLAFDRMLASTSGRGLLGVQKQINAIVKVLGILLIEMALFPIYCGILLHLAVVPVLAAQKPFPGVSLGTDWRWFFIFAYWSSGLLYMYLLSGFLKVLRTFLRPGVLYFVQDPNDPKNEPIKKILTKSWWTHVRKILSSALIYFILIVGCVGIVSFVIKMTVMTTRTSILSPIALTNPMSWDFIHLWPSVVLMFSLFKGGAVSKALVMDWFVGIWKREFSRAAAVLDLSSFLLGTKRPVREGYEEDGYFVRAPRSDRLGSSDKPIRGLFAAVDVNDQKLASPQVQSRTPESSSGWLNLLWDLLTFPVVALYRLLVPLTTPKYELTKYTVVWRPQRFWTRVFGLFIWLWFTGMRISFAGVVAPIFVGRVANVALYRGKFRNDLFIYVLGLALVIGFACALSYIIDPVRRRSLDDSMRVTSMKALACSLGAGVLLELALKSTAVSKFWYAELMAPTDLVWLNPLVYAAVFLAKGYSFDTFSGAHLFVTVGMLWSSSETLARIALWAASLEYLYIAGFWLVKKLDWDVQFRLWLHSAREDFYLIGRKLKNYPEPFNGITVK